MDNHLEELSDIDKILIEKTRETMKLDDIEGTKASIWTTIFSLLPDWIVLSTKLEIAPPSLHLKCTSPSALFKKSA